MEFLTKTSFFWGLLLTCLFGSILSMSSESWFTLWVGMEISTIFFFPILISSPPQGFVSWVIGWKYLVMQFSGSMFFFLSMVLMKGGLLESLSSFLLLIGISIKVGLFPFHSWMFHVMEYSGMTVLFLISSVQKVAPLVGIFRIHEGGVLFISVLLLTAVWGSIMSISLSSVKGLLIVSTMVFTSWLGLSSLVSWSELVWFFLIYTTHLLFFLLSIEEKQFLSGVQSLYTPNGVGGVCSSAVKTFLLGVLVGLPPFGIFMMKVEVISSMIDSGMIFPSVIITLSSGLMLFGYLKMAIPLLLMKKKIQSKWSPVTSLIMLFVFVYPLFFLF